MHPDVHTLWEHNQDFFWELGDNATEVTLRQLLDDIDEPEPLDERVKEARDEMDFNFRSDLKDHRKGLKKWIELLAPFKGKEKKIPWEFAIELYRADYGVLDEDYPIGVRVEDGNHRLCAAVYLGLRTLPAWAPT